MPKRERYDRPNKLANEQKSAYLGLYFLLSTVETELLRYFSITKIEDLQKKDRNLYQLYLSLKYRIPEVELEMLANPNFPQQDPNCLMNAIEDKAREILNRLKKDKSQTSEAGKSQAKPTLN